MPVLPSWLDPVYEAPEMRAVDAWAIEGQGVPSLDLMEMAGLSLDLMEMAGLSLARAAARAARPGPIRIVIGKGNNGGDGLVAARLLREEGRAVDLLTTAALDELGGDPLLNLARLPGPPPAAL